MFSKKDIIDKVLNRRSRQAVVAEAEAFAPTNIALVKYWGKRDSILNLPVTNSLSIALPTKGALTSIRVIDDKADIIRLNHKLIDHTTMFAKRIIDFLDLFRPHATERYNITTMTNIPVAAGVASSACGFAALTLALNGLYGWGLSTTELSILARLGSGSACRSFWNGWVEWQRGDRADGMDSFSVPLLDVTWPELRVGLLLLNTTEKSVSSREAMQRTVATSPLFLEWPQRVDSDLAQIKQALITRDFLLLGRVAEANANAMHACMAAATPSVNYREPATEAARATVRQLRDKGIPVFYTQDAGPNLKLLFLSENTKDITEAFTSIETEQPFLVEETIA